MFFLAVDEMKRHAHTWKARCVKIFAKFVHSGTASREINIADGVRREIEEAFANEQLLTPHVFDPAQRHILSSMQNDLYPRFRTSKHCSRFVPFKLSLNCTWSIAYCPSRHRLVFQLKSEGRGLHKSRQGQRNVSRSLASELVRLMAKSSKTCCGVGS